LRIVETFLQGRCAEVLESHQASVREILEKRELRRFSDKIDAVFTVDEEAQRGEAEQHVQAEVQAFGEVQVRFIDDRSSFAGAGEFFAEKRSLL